MSALFGTLWGTPGGEGSGSATVNGDAIDQTEAVAGTPIIIDLQGVSRPASVVITVGSGDTLLYATTTDADALADADDPAWTIQQASITSGRAEIVTSASVKGILVQRVSGSSSDSSVWVWAIFRGPGVPPYNPVYDPNYTVSSAGLNDARRFLDQATMGAGGVAEIDALESADLGDWVSDQTAMTVNLEVSPDISYAGIVSSQSLSAAEVSRQMIINAGQLRQKVTQALSIFIVAGNGGSTQATFNGFRWWQGLLTYALGNYRDILRHVVKNQYMGNFLNNMFNNARNAVPPNQNFARELLQLFALGQQQLNKDGAPIIDPATGLEARAYVQADIDAASRLLCGWSRAGFNGLGAGTDPANGDMQPVGILAYNGPAVTLFGVGEDTHPSFGPEGGTINSYTPTPAKVEERLEAVLDVLMAQPSMGPYVCKRLIVSMVTDNPSPQYIRRVVAAWDNNGSGETGNIGAVVRAILLDPEARGNDKPDSFGRVIEPHIAYTRLFRYLQNPSYPVHSTTNSSDLLMYNWTQRVSGSVEILPRMGNFILDADSVFYDYPADYEVEPGFLAPAATLRNSAAVAQWIGIGMANANNMATFTTSTQAGRWGNWEAANLVALHDGTAGSAAQKNEAIVDRMYADLFQGRTPSSTTRTELLAFTTWLDTQVSGVVRRKIGWLAALMTCLPEFWRIR